MLTTKTHTVAVNLDRTGGPLNWYVVTYVNGEPVEEFTQDAGPFDTVLDAVASGIAYVDRRFGSQLALDW